MDLFPLANSLRVAAISTVVVFLLGIALANVVSRAPRVVRGLADVVLTLPLVLPPTVVGFLLLMLLGPRRPLGAWALSALGARLTMVWYAAVFATVVVSFPLMYRTARGAFESFDQTLADAARTLGRSNAWVFWRVKMPCCRQGIVAGAVLAFARALGEYGATSMVCGYMPGSTATVWVPLGDGQTRVDVRLSHPAGVSFVRVDETAEVRPGNGGISGDRFHRYAVYEVKGSGRYRFTSGAGITD